MDLSHFRILINELLNKDPYIVTEESPLIILDSKSTVCMAKNVKDTKHTRRVPAQDVTYDLILWYLSKIIYLL